MLLRLCVTVGECQYIAIVLLSFVVNGTGCQPLIYFEVLNTPLDEAAVG